MPAYPLILTHLDRVRVVVVGGGQVAERKASGLLAGGAAPIVISPHITAALTEWNHQGKITWHQRCYTPGDLVGAFLVVAATNDRVVNAQIASEAREHGVLANIGDNPALGDITTTATVRRGDLVIAVTTNGASPSLTAQIRRELEQQYGEDYAVLVEQLRQERQRKRRKPHSDDQHMV